MKETRSSRSPAIRTLDPLRRGGGGRVICLWIFPATNEFISSRYITCNVSQTPSILNSAKNITDLNILLKQTNKKTEMAMSFFFFFSFPPSSKFLDVSGSCSVLLEVLMWFSGLVRVSQTQWWNSSACGHVTRLSKTGGPTAGTSGIRTLTTSKRAPNGDCTSLSGVYSDRTFRTNPTIKNVFKCDYGEFIKCYIRTMWS